MSATTLGQKQIGDIVTIKENGTPVNFIVLQQGYPTSGNGRTLLLREKLCNSLMIWDESSLSYATSNVDSWLVGTYFDSLDPDIQPLIEAVSIECTDVQNTNDPTVYTIDRKVFLLSFTEVGFPSNIGRHVEEEGTPIAYFNSNNERIGYRGSTADEWWLRTPSVGDTLMESSIFYVTTAGTYESHRLNTSSFAPRPAFTLPSSALIADDGSVIPNTPPVISSDTPSGTNLGVKEDGFTINYTVTDAQGDTVTVTESLDGVVQRTYTPTLGESNTVQCVTPDNWQTVLNGEHTISIVANDGIEASAPYTFLFTKQVYAASITLQTPMDADDQITIMILNVLGSIPSDANYQVLVTNNANDTEPVWEDATADVKSGANYLFTNQTAANGFAFNFKVIVSRGASNTGGYITNIGGAFQ